MTIKRILELVKEVTYKPGWEITARPERGGGGFGELVIIMVRTKVIDVDAYQMGEEKELVLSITFAVQPGTAEDEVLFLIQRTIIELETHEIDEWLKHKGKYVRQPHPLPKDNY